MPRAGLSEAAVVSAALEVVDESGPRALTLGAVARRCGVATPSLYKHVNGLDRLRSLVGTRVLDELTERGTQAVIGRSGADAVASLMIAYREYALDHPNRYAALPHDPHPDQAWMAAGDRLLSVILKVLAECGVTGTDAIHTTRAIRAIGHGFATLQIAGGFQMAEDVDESYRRVIDMMTASLPSSTSAQASESREIP